MAFVFQSLPRA